MDDGTSEEGADVEAGGETPEALRGKTGSKRGTGGKVLTLGLTGIIIIIIIVAALGVAAYLYFSPAHEKVLLLATTTSTANSGLLDHILPDFEKKYEAIVKVTPIGTGQALEMGRRGDVDVLMVHAPAREQAFVDEGYGTHRYLVCYNYFVLVGPPSDPAGIGDGANASRAMQMIHDKEARFASRGDDSGTHTKEKELWEAAGYDYGTDIDVPGNDWYYSVSAGMGDTLVRANELESYTLSDEGTYWAFQGDLDLEILLRDDPALHNQYSVIPLDPTRHPHANYDLAMDFAAWVTSGPVQDMIGGYQKGGHVLFTANAPDYGL